MKVRQTQMIVDACMYFIGAILVPLLLQTPLLHKCPDRAHKRTMLLLFIGLNFVWSIILVGIVMALTIYEKALLGYYALACMSLYLVQTIILYFIGRHYKVTHLKKKLLLTLLYPIALIANQVIGVIMMLTNE